MFEVILKIIILALSGYGGYALYKKYFVKAIDWEKEINSYIMNAGADIKTTGEHLRNFVTKVKWKL